MKIESGSRESKALRFAGVDRRLLPVTEWKRVRNVGHVPVAWELPEELAAAVRAAADAHFDLYGCALSRPKRQATEIRRFAKAVRTAFPGCSDTEALEIAERAAEIGSGRVGRASTLTLAERVELAVAAHLRHQRTAYDDLYETTNPLGGQHPREAVSYEVARMLETWRAGKNLTDE